MLAVPFVCNHVTRCLLWCSFFSASVSIHSHFFFLGKLAWKLVRVKIWIIGDVITNPGKLHSIVSITHSPTFALDTKQTESCQRYVFLAWNICQENIKLLTRLLRAWLQHTRVKELLLYVDHCYQTCAKTCLCCRISASAVFSIGKVGAWVCLNGNVLSSIKY